MMIIGIIIGSKSDIFVIKQTIKILDKFNILYEIKIISAHRNPYLFFKYAKEAEKKNFKIIVAAAGMAAHLPGMCAAIFPMPVIGIPIYNNLLRGKDSLYSILQMPSGIPVATMAINGGINAGIMIIKILSIFNKKLLEKFKKYYNNF